MLHPQISEIACGGKRQTMWLINDRRASLPLLLSFFLGLHDMSIAWKKQNGVLSVPECNKSHRFFREKLDFCFGALVCMCVSLKARKSYLLLQLSDTMSKERTMKSENMHGKRKSPSLLQPHRYNQPLENPPLFQMSLNMQTIHIPEAVPSGGEVCPTKQLHSGTQHSQKSTHGHLAGIVDTLLYLFLIFISDKCFTSSS